MAQILRQAIEHEIEEIIPGETAWETATRCLAELGRTESTTIGTSSEIIQPDMAGWKLEKE